MHKKYIPLTVKFYSRSLDTKRVAWPQPSTSTETQEEDVLVSFREPSKLQKHLVNPYSTGNGNGEGLANLSKLAIIYLKKVSSATFPFLKFSTQKYCESAC